MSLSALARIVTVLAVGVLAALPARAQGLVSAVEPSVPEKTGKELHAFRVGGTVPRVDGRLDDEAWASAQTIDDFIQDEPDNLKQPTEHTGLQVAYDDQYVYVAVRCDAHDASQIRTGLGRRDNFPPTDMVAIFFDPRHDHLTGYMFRANSSGVEADQTYYDDTRTDSDYDGVWDVATQVTAEGWTAEFRIPFSQMRFTVPPEGRAVWGFQFRRDIQNRGEYDVWVPRPRGAQGTVSRWGHLVFDDRLAPPRRLELLPYTLGQVEGQRGASVEQSANAGLDVRFGVGTSATISATVNPDFGQVEADPAVLNLSVFETFFQEKRPFFLEDSRTFVLPYGRMPDFYSRRIGQAPGRFALEDNQTLVGKPASTTIIGASKLTGKASGWTYGALTALTAREYATVDTTTTDAAGHEVVTRGEQLIEPMTSYDVGRVQRDILHGSSNVGAIVTAVVREKDADAFTGGGDYNFRWGSNRWGWNGHWIGTRAPISGSVENGFGGVTNFGYGGKRLGVNAHFDHFSHKFRNTDLGFLGARPNQNDLDGNLNIGNPDPWRVFRNTNFGVYGGRQWTEEGLVFGKWVGFNANLGFRNFWFTYFNVQHNFEHLDDLDTRGGPPILRLSGVSSSFGINSDSRKKWGVSLNSYGGRDADGSWDLTVGPSLRVQPSSALQASLSTNFTSARDAAQWVENTDADGDGVVDYVYGRLKRNVLNFTGRVTYSFSRSMTLEAFLQPFVAVGDFTDIRKLARPNSFEFIPVTIEDDPDFNNKSLRGTVVLRWEYLRGSTLFLVWNLSGSDPSRPGVFSPMRDLADAFTARGTSVFAVKLTYWFTP